MANSGQRDRYPDRGEHCACCGASLKENLNGLSKGLCRGLVALAHASRRDYFKPQFIRDLKISYSDRGNFNKLQYWGLIRNTGDKKKRVPWAITPLGWRFLRGEAALPCTAVTYRDEPVKFEGITKTIDQIADGYRYREDYARDQRPHTGDNYGLS